MNINYINRICMNQDPIYILLADDDEDDRLFLRDAISQLPMNTIVDTVNDGAELIDFLLKPGADLPHILFLDLNMPKKSGMECLIEIRQNFKLKDLSVAIYSTSSAEKDIEAAFVKGANIYINKPSDFAVLKNILSKVLSVNWQYLTSGLNRENFLLNI